MSTLGQIQKFQLHQDLKDEIDNKVIKETGKGLSTNDFTNEYKQKIDNTKTIEVISQSDYDALSDSQKNDSTKIYAIY